MSKSGTTGLEECLKNFNKFKKDYEREAKASLIKWGRNTIDDSKENFCPIDTGLMKGTGNIETGNEGNIFYVLLFYNTPYAPTVHESTKPYHPIGESGFLLKPFYLHAPKLPDDIKTGLEKVVK